MREIDVFNEADKVVVVINGALEPRLDFVIKITPMEAFLLAARLIEEAKKAKERIKPV